MGGVLTATTPDLIEDDFIAIIQALAPRITWGADSKFTYYDRRAAPSTRTRRFTLRWEDIHPYEAGLMGKNTEEMEADCIITVDYGGINEIQVEKVAGDDHHLIEDTLQARKHPTLTGLMWIETLGYEPIQPDNEGDQAQYEHRYAVRWIAARA